MSQTLTPEAAQGLRRLIDEALANPAPAPAAAPMAPSDFCTIWPSAKPIVQGLTAIAVLIPGYGQAAAAALTALTAVGDQIHKQTCSS